MMRDEQQADQSPKEKSEVCGLPIEDFSDPSRRQPKTNVIHQHFNRSALGLSIIDRPIKIHQITQNDVAPIMVPILKGIAANAREQKPENNCQEPVDIRG